MVVKLNEHDPHFKDEVMAEPGGEHLETCFACGTCTSSCLIGYVNPEYNPRRMIHYAVLGMKDRLMEYPPLWLCTACDACYKRCPQDIHISEVLQAIRNVLHRYGANRPGPIARVNERTCVACGLCVEVCPYEAPALVTKRVLGHEKTVSQIDRFKCQGCGLCAAACRSASIDLEEDEYSDETIFEQIPVFSASYAA